MDKNLIDYIKLLTKRDKKNLIEKNTKAIEELGELAKKVLPFCMSHTTQHRFVDRNGLLEEIADITLVVWSMAFQLGFDVSDIEEMVKSKATIWDEKQSREDSVKFPLPYEIHITVSSADVEQFKRDCLLIGVKPIFLDLHTNSGGMIRDVMTSSVHIGDNSSVYVELERIVSALSAVGYDVVRKKIETVPWHPAAPSIKDTNPKMPQDCYFESHLAVSLLKEEDMDVLAEIIKNIDEKHSGSLRLSRNILKRKSDHIVIMTTYREYDGVYENFLETVKEIKSKIENSFSVEKEIIEFSLYDTKVKHDKAWIG